MSVTVKHMDVEWTAMVYGDSLFLHRRDKKGTEIFGTGVWDNRIVSFSARAGSEGIPWFVLDQLEAKLMEAGNV